MQDAPLCNGCHRNGSMVDVHCICGEGSRIKEQIQKFQDRCSALGAFVKKVQNASSAQNRIASRSDQNGHPMQVNVVKQPVVSGRRTEGTLDNIDVMDKDHGSCQDVLSDVEIGSSGQEKRSFSAVITQSERGQLQNLAIPTVDTDEESGKWVKKVSRKHVIKGTTTGSQIRGVRMTRRKNVFVHRLDTLYKVDIDAEYYETICDSYLWGTDIHVRDFKKK